MAGEEETMTKRTICRCGRPIFYATGNPTPYCPGCEYMNAATCDCSPVETPEAMNGPAVDGEMEGSF